MNHTPGEWYVYSGRYGSPQIRCNPTKPRGRVKIIAELIGGSVRERKANALLLAVAPDLLAACEAVMGWWYSNQSEQPPVGLVDLTIRKTKEAI